MNKIKPNIIKDKNTNKDNIEDNDGNIYNTIVPYYIMYYNDIVDCGGCGCD